MLECEICHRTASDFQIQYCTKAQMYLCSKHKNQFLRHGCFCSDEKLPRTCEICGRTGNSRQVIWSSKADKYLCSKHAAQFNKYGRFLERTKRDINEYILHDDYAEIVFYAQDQKTISGKAMIDLEDVERCRQHKWVITEMLGNTQYVRSTINKKNVSLHRFVLGYSGELFVDHINRNGLDNRKSNLRIVSYSENSTNSKTRSNTNEKNIYFKNNKYQVQIIRNYQNVYIKSFDTLGEAVAARDSFLSEYNKQNHRVV